MGNGEVICLITTITGVADARAVGYHQRCEHETGNKQLNTSLRDRGGCCARRARTWCARRATVTC